MKKYTITTFQIVILTFVFYGLTFAQNNNDSIQQKSLRERDIDLKIAIVKKKISVGEKIELKISLKNNFSNPVSLMYMNYDFFGGFQVEITDSKGKIIQPSKDPQENQGFGSFSRWEVDAKTEDKRILILSNFYELKPGKYSVTVNRKVNNSKKLEAVSVKSNSIELMVVQ